MLLHKISYAHVKLFQGSISEIGKLTYLFIIIIIVNNYINIINNKIIIKMRNVGKIDTY